MSKPSRAERRALDRAIEATREYIRIRDLRELRDQVESFHASMGALGEAVANIEKNL